MSKAHKHKVMIAGIGGASLGTELLKCLILSGRYEIFGCDISTFAYGHYQEGVEKTFVVDLKDYIGSVLDICKKERIDYIVPGGEEPMILLSDASQVFASQKIGIASNSPEVIKKFSDKEAAFKILAGLGFKVPFSMAVKARTDLENISFPVVVKPSTGTGGSNFVFLTSEPEEAFLYAQYIAKNGKVPILQEYLSEEEGEFTVGVLSLPDGEVACSVALKRIFNSKLSVLSKTADGLISSGYSQGLIDDFPEVCATAEKIARAIRSTGPINIQGRVRNGVLIPFEINPRFSASCYLRALAGVNEVDIFLKYLFSGVYEKSASLNKGYYLRSFSEIFVEKGKVKQ